ncbi:hypothetical protein DEO72_LG4g365 [Vigna unguiculata]|uniref:Uncharacterized protein n=1 Tax=Vigna unguiculata TaxID=3917 RepID=A0A4D6LLF4_VIGUN|nr:hypothetical protein DEO72_LG4g365 [Vigna unguiculata]
MKKTPAQMAKQRNHHSLVDHENFAHLLPSIKLMIIARRTTTYNTTMQQNGGCLHLWWIPLLDPELLISELCVTSVTMNQISLTTRLALNEFQASCYSHHRSQSALSETN